MAPLFVYFYVATYCKVIHFDVYYYRKGRRRRIFYGKNMQKMARALSEK